RNPHHFEPEARTRPHNRGKPTGAEQVLETVGAAWSARKLLTQQTRHNLHVRAFDLVPLDAEPPLPAAVSEASREQWKVLRRDGVDRAAHEGRLDRATLLQRLRQSVSSEVSQARPKPDVRRGRVLRLQPAEALEGPCEGNG